MVTLPFTNYHARKYNKTQIYIHHTISPTIELTKKDGKRGVAKYWTSQNNNVSTPYLIDSDGSIAQLYDTKYWAYHLGLKEKHFSPYRLPYKNLNKSSIGIEIVSLGPVMPHKDDFIDVAYGKYKLTKDQVISFSEPYRGYKHWHKYTPEQIEAVRLVLLVECKKHNIPKHYNEDMWDISTDALSNVPGIWTHTSVRPDKSDVYPDPKLIKMLKSLKPKPKYIPPKQNLVFTTEEHERRDLINSLAQQVGMKNIYND